ncbi:hypothetical protein, partial [Methyloceanibacter sp.]|uniref:hypothetical protein n=1 Tax=Methyloceanibacter sp. TaxID=1965321 RepID=UPI00351ADBD0
SESYFDGGLLDLVTSDCHLKRLSSPPCSGRITAAIDRHWQIWLIWSGDGLTNEACPMSAREATARQPLDR